MHPMHSTKHYNTAYPHFPVETILKCRVLAKFFGYIIPKKRNDQGVDGLDHLSVCADSPKLAKKHVPLRGHATERPQT